MASNSEDDVGSGSDDSGVRNFRSVHIMGTCAGHFIQHRNSDENSAVSKTVTSCSRSTDLSRSRLVPQSPGQKSYVDSKDPSFAELPLELKDAISATESTIRILRALFYIAMALTTSAIILIASSLCFVRRSSGICGALCMILSCLSIFVSSCLATSVSYQAARMVSKLGRRVGMNATGGTKFIMLVWLSFIFLTVGEVRWSFAVNGPGWHDGMIQPFVVWRPATEAGDVYDEARLDHRGLRSIV